MRRPGGPEDEVPVEWHLEELSERLKKIVLVFIAVLLTITFIPVSFSKSYVPIVTLLTSRMADYVLPRQVSWMGRTYNVTLIYTSPFGGFNVILYTSLLITLLLVSPYIAYHAYAYISPALYEHERKRLKGGSVAAVGLFTLGAMLGFFALAPVTMRIMLLLQAAPAPQNHLMVTLTYSKLIDFVVKITLTTGIAFEIPLIIYYLIVFRVIEAEKLKGYNSRLAFIIILFIAAIITPDPSGLTMLMLAIPYYIVFLLGVHLGEKRLKSMDDAGGLEPPASGSPVGQR